jgi:hypothetical protein
MQPTSAELLQKTFQIMHLQPKDYILRSPTGNTYAEKELYARIPQKLIYSEFRTLGIDVRKRDIWVGFLSGNAPQSVTDSLKLEDKNG